MFAEDRLYSICIKHPHRLNPFSASSQPTDIFGFQSWRRETPSSSNVIDQTNRSCINILEELGEDRNLLKFLRSKDVTIVPQFEVTGAGPEPMLHGNMIDGKGQLWIYFTFIGGCDNFNKDTGGNRMISFYTFYKKDKQGPSIEPQHVHKVAIASQAFGQARNYRQFVVGDHHLNHRRITLTW